MKSFQISKAFIPDRLQSELLAAGVPVTCVRASWAKEGDTTALKGEIVTDNAANDTTVQSVITNHSSSPTFTEKLDTLTLPVRLLAAHNAIIVARLDGVSPPGWAVDMVREAQARIVTVGG